MFLGKLEPMQESRLVQLKQCMTELQKDKAPSDPVVLRFLRARDFNVEKAREMLSASLIWRKKHGVDKILSEYQVRVIFLCIFETKLQVRLILNTARIILQKFLNIDLYP